MVAETSLRVDDLIAPLFVREGIETPQPILSLPGVVQHTLASLRDEVRQLVGLGVPAVILFGVPVLKDATGSGAWHSDGIVQRALSDLRDDLGDAVVLIADLCVDEYTDHGHCGVLDGRGSVDNDATLDLYRRIAVAQARAGADIVAPSGMMDGQVAAIRGALDDAGYDDRIILAYAAKYASALYGPFREAVDVSIADGGDRKGYQQDFRNGREAIVRGGARYGRGRRHGDGEAGARVSRRDRPGARRDQTFRSRHITSPANTRWSRPPRPTGGSMGRPLRSSIVTAIKRAGADLILTYFAREIAEALH